MSSSSQSQHTPANASESKASQQQQQPLPQQSPLSLPSVRPLSSLLLPVSAAMPNALHDFASNLASPNRFSNLSDWTSQPQHQHYPVPVSGQQFLPPSYSGHSILPPAYSGQNDLSHMTRDQSASFVNKLSSTDAFAASSFDSLARSSLPQTFQPNQFHQQLQLAQMISAQQPHQQLPFASPQYSQSPQPVPTSQPTYQPLRVSRSLPSDMPSFDQLRGSAMPPSDSAYQREQAPFSIGAQLGITSYPNTTNSSSLNTSMPSDPRAASLSTQSLSYTNLSFPTAHGVMSSHELASFAAVLGTRTNAVHEWLTDNSAPPGIAVHQGPFVTSLDTRLPLPPSPASASLASPATANTSISSSLDGSEVPSGPFAVRSASGALSSPSSASPTVSPKDTSNTVAGGKRVRDESVLSLSQLADQEIERHLRFSQNSLSLSSLSSQSNPVSPSISSSSIARVPTPSGTLSQSFTTISLSSMGPSDASDPSSYLFQRPSPSAGPSASSSTASLPECASVSSLIFNRSHQPQRFTPSSRFGSSPQMPISLDDSASDGSTSPSKKIKSGPAAFPSPLSSSISLPSSSSYPTSGVPSLTWPAQSPAARQYPSPPASSSSGSAYPFNAVPTNRPSKKAGKAESKGPKNPRSAYVYFVADQRKKLARTETLANSTFQEVASALGARWRGLSPEERRPFEEMARRDKERYQTEKTRSFEDM